jgi:hypothetical protein
VKDRNMNKHGGLCAQSPVSIAGIL